MINVRNWLRIAALCALCATATHAQYRRIRSDTVRLREITTGSTAVTTPTGIHESRSEHDATVIVAFGGADSARAWYESLRIASISPQGRQEPVTRDALSCSFDLFFDARGRSRTLRAPKFPASFEATADLSHQFDDFFARLPAEPLSLGLAWEDTAVVETRGPDDDFFRGQRVIRSRVARDTTVAGEAAGLIESVQRNTLAGAQRLKGQPLTLRTAMAGSDSGTVVFSKRNGRMLARQRVGSMSGTITYMGGTTPVVLPIQQRYDNTVRRVP